MVKSTDDLRAGEKRRGHYHHPIWCIRTWVLEDCTGLNADHFVSDPNEVVSLVS